MFLDITATSDDRATTVELASRASEQLHLPYCVGGGFRSVADIRKMIAAGADAPFARPAWLGAEVTDAPRYYNLALASRPYSQWREDERAALDVKEQD